MQGSSCQKCGLKFDAGELYCSHCGERLDVQDIISDNERQFDVIKSSLAEKFDIIKEIGHGGMSTVYKAVQKNLGRTVALKTINGNLIHDPGSVRLFYQEARTASSLQHPNIITIYDQGETNGVFYISMEYLEGMELHQIIEKFGTIDSQKFIGYFSQLADALQYLKERGLVHRDIKPSNIFITTEGRCVIMDFGISRIIDVKDHTEAYSIVGTPEYMSPEQASGDEVDERSDLYSLGVVMFKCLTGKLPFTDHNPTDLFDKIIHQIPPRPSELTRSVNPGIEKIVLRLLRKDPDHRIQSGQELKLALLSKGVKYSNLPEKVLKASIIVLGLFIISALGYIFIDQSKNQADIIGAPLDTIQQSDSSADITDDDETIRNPAGLDNPAETVENPPLPNPVIFPDVSSPIAPRITQPATSNEQRATVSSGKFTSNYEEAVNRAHEFIDLGKTTDAIEQLEEAARLDPENSYPGELIKVLKEKQQLPPK